MSSRMSKYFDENSGNKNEFSRVNKNEGLYREINKNAIDNYEVKSNATILGNNENNIDVEKIKKILDTKYNNAPQRRSIRIEEEEVEEEKQEITKEYDINVILEKAREQKEVNYEEERLKKLRNTQYDILNNLNLEPEKDQEERTDEEDLKSLIMKISDNEASQNKDIKTSLDILSDLKGSGNTEVLNGLKEEIEKAEEQVKEEIKKPNLNDTQMINSFYTSSNAIKNKDFEDLDDFKGDIENNNTFLKIIIAIIVIVFLVGVFLLIKTILFT